MGERSVLVAGASGLVGGAVLRHFGARDGWRARGVSRRNPGFGRSVEFLSLDLEDAAAVATAVAAMGDVTHLVYAALQEGDSLYSGWLDREQMALNQRMLENLFEPLLQSAPGLRHVTLLQGTKAYGAHLGPIRVPAREREARIEHENFYWLQEDYLRTRRSGADWRLTILRPQIVFGDALGVALNPLPALCAYAAVLRDRGEPLHFPGGGPILLEAVDADLLAGCVAWACEAEAAADQTFNVTNGDVFLWQNVWPTIADALGMATGAARPRRLAEWMPAQAEAWQAIVRKYDLDTPELLGFAGLGFQYLDFVMASGATEHLAPSIVSTVKLRAAGFHPVLDTEDMFRKWIERLQQQRRIPPRR
jgi:nucleoside-diphosphate-sugar epimerase